MEKSYKDALDKIIENRMKLVKEFRYITENMFIKNLALSKYPIKSY